MSRKTYILPPNLTTHPGGSLAIGTIIADPWNPLKPLSTLKKPLETVTHTEIDAELKHGSGKGFSTSVWANFLQIASAKVSGGIAADRASNYKFTSLETVTLRDYPSDEYAANRASEPKVKAAMHAGALGRDPVYMITGMKIARGFQLAHQEGHHVHGGVGGTVPITDQVSAGAEVQGERNTEHSYSSRTENDIIFAYQLHVIAEKGWRKKKVTVDDFVPKGGLLRKHDDENVEDAVDTDEATEDDLLAAVEDAQVKSMEARDGEKSCVCLYIGD